MSSYECHKKGLITYLRGVVLRVKQLLAALCNLQGNHDKNIWILYINPCFLRLHHLTSKNDIAAKKWHVFISCEVVSHSSILPKRVRVIGGKRGC